MRPSRWQWEWEQLTWLVGCVLATGVLEDEPPVSLMLLGDPGAGKSTLLRRFEHIQTVMTLSDVTSDALRHVVFPRAEAQRIRHLLFPEFYKLFQRSQNAVENTTGVLTAAMSGELHHVIQGEREMAKLPAGFTLGVVGAMTNKVHRQWSGGMSATGMQDRFLTVELVMSVELRERIILAVAMQDAVMTQPVQWPFVPDQTYAVKLPEPMARYFHQAVINTEAGGRVRFVGQMRAMLKALTLLHGEYVVTEKRVEQLHRMMTYILGRKPIGGGK